MYDIALETKKPIISDSQKARYPEYLARRLAISDQCDMFASTITKIIWEGLNTKLLPADDNSVTTGEIFLSEYYRLQAIVDKFIEDEKLPKLSDEKIALIKASKLEAIERIFKENKEKGLIYEEKPIN